MTQPIFSLFNCFLVISLIVTIKCSGSISNGEVKFRKNSSYNIEKNLTKVFFLEKSGDKLLIRNQKGQVGELLHLSPDFDSETHLAATGNCLHILSSTKGISSYCPNNQFDLNKFISANKENNLEKLPKRRFRWKKPHSFHFKAGIKLRKGSAGRHYLVSPYNLSLNSKNFITGAKGNFSTNTWQPLKTGRSYHEAITDIVEIVSGEKIFLLLASPYNGLKRAALYKKTSLKKGSNVFYTGKWSRVGKGLPSEEYIPGLFFYESIRSIVGCNKKIYAALGFGKGLWVSKDRGESFQKIKFTSGINPDIRHLSCTKPISIKNSNGNAIIALLLVSGKNFAAFYDTKKQKIIKEIYPKSIPKDIITKIQVEMKDKDLWVYVPLIGGLFHIQIDPGKNSRKSKNSAAPIRGLYLPAKLARGKRLEGRLNKISSSGFNAIVVDFKDDFGRLVYNSKIPLAKEIGAVRKLIDVPRLLRLAGKYNISVIARLVVFKDKKLFAYKKNLFAFGKKNSRKPWQYFREYWVDPHCEQLWDYHIEIARELEKLGIDEIQFDYIRFPSDGPKHLIVSKCSIGRDSLKSESLFDFLKRANRLIKIPIGVDLYGFNSWYRAGAVIGQDIVMFSGNVQVISPMYYPSHFGSRWFIKGPKSKRGYRILQRGTSRALELVSNKTIIRPFLQAFNYKSPTFGKAYLLNQAKGVLDAKADSFYYWNARGKYQKLLKVFRNWQPGTYKPR